jgi:alpha/beta superfamily hydrolase
MRTPNERTRIAATDSNPELDAVTATCDGRPAIVAPPHPLYGGSIAIPAVGSVFDALADAGFSPTAFNWRGVEGSDGEPSGEMEDAVTDYQAAIGHVAADSGTVIAAGYSWGAAAALLATARSPQVERLILIAPPLPLLEDRTILHTGRPMHVIAAGNDMFSPIDALHEALGSVNGATLDIIDGADHFFSTGGIDEVERLVRAKF